MTQKYSDLKIENIGNSKLKITAKVDTSRLEGLVQKELQDRAKNMVIPGFRKGEAPLDLVKKHVNEESLKQEAAKKLTAEAMAQIIIDNDLKVIGNPDIQIDIKDNHIDLDAGVIVLPDVQIDSVYKDAIKKINQEPLEEAKVTDEDVEQVIKHLRREKARILALEAMQKQGQNQPLPDINSIPEDKLPQLDERDFKELAGASNLDEFKEKVRQNIKTEREFAIKDARRAKIAEELLKYVKVDLPEEIVKLEFENSMRQMQADLQIMGLTLDSYLKQIGKSKEEFEAEVKKASESRAKLQLALDKIAEMENITVSKEELDKEVQRILQYSPGANPAEVSAFVDAQISNNKVFEYLESLK